MFSRIIIMKCSQELWDARILEDLEDEGRSDCVEAESSAVQSWLHSTVDSMSHQFSPSLLLSMEAALILSVISVTFQSQHVVIEDVEGSGLGQGGSQQHYETHVLHR